MPATIRNTTAPPLIEPKNDQHYRTKQSLANDLAHRASLGRIVALVVNERLVNAVFDPFLSLYYIRQLPETNQNAVQDDSQFVISGTAPFLSSEVGHAGHLKPELMHESNITIGNWLLQRQQIVNDSGDLVYVDVDKNVTAVTFVEVLRTWTEWDDKLTSVFQERIKNSTQYLEDEYLSDRPCPTRDSDFVEWEQSILEGNGHPLHKCRMPIDPETQPLIGYNFKQTRIAFMAVQRSLLEIHGPLEEELKPLLRAAGVNSCINADEIIIPVHEFQINFLLKMAQGKARGALRLLEQRIAALAQSSTRTMTVPGLPGLGIKLSLSVIISGNVRTINKHWAYNAVRFSELGMLDSEKVSGLRDSPLEIIPEVAFASGMSDNLGVMIRWDPGHSSRPINADIGYAVAGALCERSTLHSSRCVAECVFGLSTLEKKLQFLRHYVRIYLQCFLRPLLTNSMLLYAHGQNALLRYSKSTGQLLGFSVRDMSDTYFNKDIFERTTGISPDARMENHDIPVADLMRRGHFLFFVSHMTPLVMALGLSNQGPPSFTHDELLAVECNGDTMGEAIEDSADTNGWSVVTRALHKALVYYERSNDTSAQELASKARIHWLASPTWSLEAFISQRMRADWAHRHRHDKLSRILVPNFLTKQETPA
ncbi:hypothetical protein K461DRAFT_321262 [Myriangium duriaei CBS 260.36]|uniref:Aerobactin siderophore biosynthesis IucA/IucC N-terminal domain-containing protein n=1 Tax=Myriangium duriaei CBS 260.36 TaxID=1168546 RepID=A0A9P4J2U1_9PEZI|nr:hypothetical protein K461DRAFT_321262 [Myriangium duriaei CBS 260.36]